MQLGKLARESMRSLASNAHWSRNGNATKRVYFLPVVSIGFCPPKTPQFGCIGGARKHFLRYLFVILPHHSPRYTYRTSVGCPWDTAAWVPQITRETWICKLKLRKIKSKAWKRSLLNNGQQLSLRTISFFSV